MSKPYLIADVRSILRRSLPETGPQSPELDCAVLDEPISMIPFPLSPEPNTLDRARQVMQTLEAASVVERLFPGARLVLLSVPEPVQPRWTEKSEPLPMREFRTREPKEDRPADLAAIVRTAMVEDLNEDLPSAAESLLAELGMIERQNRSYYQADSRSDDATAAFNYRQRRRSDILAELLELKRSVQGPMLDPAS